MTMREKMARAIVDGLLASDPGRDGWTPWRGGVMPVGEDELVDLAWMDGDCEINQRAGDEDWTLTEGDDAVVAYRHYATPR